MVGSGQRENLDLAAGVHEYLCLWGNNNDQLIGLLYYDMLDFHSSRPGHDLRYALDGLKLSSMGFTFPVDFEESLQRTVEWLMENPSWLGR